jgi:hypothetical protein
MVREGDNSALDTQDHRKGALHQDVNQADVRPNDDEMISKSMRSEKMPHRNIGQKEKPKTKKRASRLHNRLGEGG